MSETTRQDLITMGRKLLYHDLYKKAVGADHPSPLEEKGIDIIALKRTFNETAENYLKTVPNREDEWLSIYKEIKIVFDELCDISQPVVGVE